MSLNKRPDHLLGWSDEENATLLRLKSQYDNWKDIHKLNLFPSRSPAAVQVQYSRLKNGRPRSTPGQARGRPKRPGASIISTPNIAPIKRSAATDSPRQPLSSPKRSRKSRRLTDSASYQNPSSSEGEDLPWDCNTETADPTPSQSHRPQGWLHRSSHSQDQEPSTPSAPKPANTPDTRSVSTTNEKTANIADASQKNIPLDTRSNPPDRFRATPAAASTSNTPHTTARSQPLGSGAPDTLIAKLKMPNTGPAQALPTSGNNSPVPPEPRRQVSGFTSVNQASQSPSVATPPQGNIPPRDIAHGPSRTPSMPPPHSVPAHDKRTSPVTPALQSQTTAGMPPVPVASATHIEKPPTPPAIAAQPSSTPSQTKAPMPVVQTSQGPIPAPPGSVLPKLSSAEYFNKANEYMSRGIDTIVEDMTAVHRIQIEKLILENKALQASLNEVTVERDSLKNQVAAHVGLVKEVEELREEKKGMEEYIQKIGEMAARFTRKD
ncbi:hypothetical protein BJX64DRAFT_259240 [Aspergillus heterothallicus]